MSEHGRLPHLAPFELQPIVFLTVATHERRRILACETAHLRMRKLWAESQLRHGWAVGRYMIMPDHVHLFARPAIDAKPLSRWMQTWKSLTSRAIANELGIAPPIWQKDYFDRFVRSADDYTEKWNYVAANPARAGLVRSSGEWRWQGVIWDLRF